jgi:hypothetical protein
MTRLRFGIMATTTLLLCGCDPISPGYINRLNYPITIVEDPTRPRGGLHLAPGEEKLGGFGFPPKAVDVLDAKARRIAHYRLHDIPRPDRGADDYIVFSPEGAKFGSSSQRKHEQ